MQIALLARALQSGQCDSTVNVKKVIIRDAVKTTEGLALLKMFTEFSAI